MWNNIWAYNHANHTLVHHPMYCGFSPKMFCPCTLHSGLCYISDPCWPDMHDRKSSGVPAECTQGLPRVLCRELFCHSLLFKTYNRASSESRAGIWKEFWFSEATCIITCVSRHSAERHNGQLLYSDWWRLSTGIGPSVWADQYEECRASSKCFQSWRHPKTPKFTS